jgi:hypothetical protein
MRWPVVLALIVAAISGYVAINSATVRYRLTLEAEVDGVRKTGSGVIEVSYSKQTVLISQAEFGVDFRGEAVVVDLGTRGLLFALLRQGTDSRSGPDYIVLRAFNFPGGALPRPVLEGLGKVRRLSGKVDLPLTSLPLLVRFRNPNDLQSVERVDPLDIGKSFGVGTRLVRASLEIVSSGTWPFSVIGISGEPITRGIGRWLDWQNLPKPWLKPTGNGNFVDTRTDTFKVNKEDFQKG